MKPTFYQVELIGSGFLAVMTKPVSEWLQVEISGLAMEGVERVISLLEPHEEYELGLNQEGEMCKKNRIDFIRFPIPDRGVPSCVSSFAELTKNTYHQSAGGHSTVIHCRAGIGRSGLVAASVLLHCVFKVEEAFSKVSASRGVNVPDTEQQREWLYENQSVILGRT